MYSKKLFIQNTVKSAQQFQHFLKAFKKLVLSIKLLLSKFEFYRNASFIEIRVLSIKVTFIDITFFIDKTLIYLNLKYHS